MIVDRATIVAAKSPNGGWTREQLAKWGVSWPPPKGWQQALETGAAVPGVRPEPIPPRVVTLEMFAVITGDQPGHMRAWANEKTAWDYGQVLGVPVKRVTVTIKEQP